MIIARLHAEHRRSPLSISTPIAGFSRTRWQLSMTLRNKLNWRVFPNKYVQLLACFIALFIYTPLAVQAASDQSRPNNIVVYYANETTTRASESANYRSLLDILRSSPNPIATQIADSIVHDSTAFPAAVRKDVEALKRAGRHWKLDIAIFTNELALKGQFLHFTFENNTLNTADLPALPASQSPVLAVSPLSRSDYFQNALLSVARLYPKNTLNAVLITNTHGSQELALSPRVFADISLARAGDILASIDNARAASSEMPEWAAIRGTGKIEFWRPIAEVGRQFGMTFQLVFREACASGISGWSEFNSIPDNVVNIAHTGQQIIRYHDIDYTTIFENLDGSDTFLDFLTNALIAKNIAVEKKNSIALNLVLQSLIPYKLLFSVPFAIWLIWYFWRIYSINQIRRSLKPSGPANMN